VDGETKIIVQMSIKVIVGKDNFLFGALKGMNYERFFY
jgi:hypothetical protein